MLRQRAGMTCRELVDSVAAYLDGELPGEARPRFDEHLAACAECAAYVETYRRTVELAKGAYQDADVPDDLLKSVLARINPRGR